MREKENPILLQQGMAVLNRVTDSDLSESQRMDEVLLATAERFIDFADQVSTQVDVGGYNKYDKGNIIP